MVDDFFAGDFFAGDFLPAVFFAGAFFAAFLTVDFFADTFFVVDFFAEDFFADADFFGGGGTFFPARRASDRPIAIACFGFVTFLLLRPDLRVPRFISFISVSTCFEAPGLYLRELPAFFVAIVILPYFDELGSEESATGCLTTKIDESPQQGFYT